MVERDGTPQTGLVAAVVADGRRVLANTRDPDLMDAMMREAWEGREVAVRTDGTTTTAHPT